MVFWKGFQGCLMRKLQRAIYFMIMVTVAGGASPQSEGFLVPGATAIPSEFQLFFKSFTGTQYALQFNSAVDGSRLLISEHTESGGASYEQQVSTMEAMRYNKHGVIPDKLREFVYKGLNGVVYNMENATPRNIVLLLHDDGKLLRVSAYDGTKHRFSPDDIIGMLSRFERQG
jgi:hypothetical protein